MQKKRPRGGAALRARLQHSVTSAVTQDSALPNMHRLPALTDGWKGNKRDRARLAHSRPRTPDAKSRTDVSRRFWYSGSQSPQIRRL